ncbi:MAG: cation:proton antiporter [Fimbriimonadaceae bacterium]|nr:cation:proton antiporter [Fimbriimonadaceae bacterium]
MTGWGLLLDLVATLAAAFLLGALMERFRQSAVLGYIAAGVVLGPGVAGVVRESGAVHSLAEIGVALLLFSIGLEFSWKGMLKMGRIALVGGSIQIVLTGSVAFGLAVAFGLDPVGAIAIGAVVALSSTAVVVRALRERNALDASYGRAAIGILLVQDVALVPLVLLVNTLGTEVPGLTIRASLPVLINLGIVVLSFGLVLLLLLPRALLSRAMTRNRELPILLAITTCIAAAYGAHAVGVSPSLGAFVAGMLLGESAFADQIRVDVLPLRTLFVTLFFASVGMLADPAWIVAHPLQVLGVAGLVLVGKATIGFLAVRASGLTIVNAMATGLALAQVGELSFVLLQLAASKGVLEPDTVQVLTSASVATLLASPTLVATAPGVARRLAVRLFSPRRLAVEERHGPRTARSGHVVLVGFGEAGESASRVLSDAGVAVFVLELNPALVRRAESQGLTARIGDATHPDILEGASIRSAETLVVALPDGPVAKLVISEARRRAPHLRIVARSRYHQLVDDLRASGATVVVDEEFVMGRELGNATLERQAAQEDEDDPGVSLR